MPPISTTGGTRIGLVLIAIGLLIAGGASLYVMFPEFFRRRLSPSDTR